MAKERVLHSERRPYVAAGSLDELVGPTTGLHAVSTAGHSPTDEVAQLRERAKPTEGHKPR